MNKKAQEELFGFVIIVVMIVIIGLVFLFFYKPKTSEIDKNIKVKIDNLLYSIMSYNAEGGSVSEMIEECNKGSGCDYLSDKLSDMLNATLEKSALIVGKQIRGYSLNITDTIGISEGETTGNMIGSFVPVTEYITARLSFYY